MLMFDTNGQDCINPNDESINFNGDGTAQIMWTSIPQAQEYQVQYKVSNILSAWEDKFTTNSFVSIDGLIDGLDGEYRVRSKCSNEWKEWEEPTDFTAPVVTCSEMDETITFNSDGTTATVSWDPIPNASEYRFHYREVGAVDWIIGFSFMTQFNSSTSEVLNNLIPETDYEYRTLVNCIGFVPLQTFGNFTTPSPSTSCGNPEVTVTVNNDGTVTFTWDPVPNATSYSIYYGPVGGSAGWTTSNTESPITLSFNNITVDQEYWFYFTTECPSGTTSPSPTNTFIINSSELCSNPNDVQVVFSNNGDATMSWSPISSANSYDLRYRLKNSNDPWVNMNTTSTTFTLQNLILGVNYEYQLKSICDNNPGVFNEIGYFNSSPIDLPPNTSCGVIFENCEEELIDYIQTNLGSCKQWEGCNNDGFIHRSGRVGISTDEMASGFNLAVKGGIITDYINVQLCEDGVWCDYVFEPEYNLNPLIEVEKHIAEKGHLHNTPSIADIKEAGGVELKETKLNQQEKIEEIFLHLIAMNNRVEKLKEEVEKLEQENNNLILNK